jgi:hypothetical protein
MLAASFALSAQLRFEGPIPPEVNALAMTAQYHRIFRIIAPRRLPDKTPLKIIYYSKTNAPENASALPEWGGGGTIGGNLIIIPVDFKPFLQQNFSQTTVHELVHAVIYRVTGSAEVPRWFHEGLAMTLSGELSFEENAVLSKAVLFNRLMPLSAIDSVNSFGKGRAELAYCQSHAAVLFLIDQYGMDVVADCLSATRKKRDFWKGFYEVVSLSPREFEDLAHKYIASKYQLVFLVTDTYAWWVGIASLFIVGFFVTIRRNRLRAEAMEAKEQREAEALRRAQEREKAENKNDADKPPSDI